MPLLISYSWMVPIEIDLREAEDREKLKAKMEKREPAFERFALKNGSVLTLRKNNTTVVSESELNAIKETLGERGFKRCIVEHGAYEPRSLFEKKEKPVALTESSTLVSSEPKTPSETTSLISEPEALSETSPISVSARKKSGRRKNKNE